MADAKRDGNSVATLLAVSSVDGVTPVTLYADPTTHRLLVDATGGGSFVPYTGATGPVDLGNNNLTVDSPTFFVDSVNHRVGVGTITPATKVEVLGADPRVRITTDGTGSFTSGLQLYRNALNQVQIYNDGSAVNVKFDSYGVGATSFGGFLFRNSQNTSGTFSNSLYIGGNGNIGIQTATIPASNFQVSQFTTAVGIVATAGTTTLTGTNTTFTNTFKVGDTITVQGETVRTIATITSDTVLDSTVAFSTTASALTYTLTGGIRFQVKGNGNVQFGGDTVANLYRSGPGLLQTDAKLGIGILPLFPLHVSGTAGVIANIRSTNGAAGDDMLMYFGNGRSLVGWDGTYGGLNFSTSDNGKAIIFGHSLTTGTGEVARVYQNKFSVGVAAPTTNFQVGQFTTSIGTVATTGTTALVGTGTTFANTFKVGDSITVSGETVRTIATITDNLNLTVTVAFSNTASGLSYTLPARTCFSVMGNGNIVAGSGTGSITGNIFANVFFSTAFGNTNGTANALFNPATTGSTISRNVGDANPCLIVQQIHASSTGDILRLSNSGGVVDYVNQTGKFFIGAGTPTTNADGIQFGTDTSANLYRSAAGTIKTDGAIVAVSNVYAQGLSNINNTTNAYIGMPLTGTTISRNIADANIALKVTQTHASSTGSILELANSGGTVVTVAQTGVMTLNQVINTANAITASGNAATIPVTSKHNIVTNNSAATLTVTLTTAGAVNMQSVIVQILDFSAVAQTLTLVNTENSTVTAPASTNGSTTLPLTLGFIFNSATSKWRLIASA